MTTSYPINRLAPHVRALLGHLEGSSIEIAATRIMNNYGGWLRERANIRSLSHSYERALSIRRALGSEYPHVAQSLNNLARLYHAQGRYPKRSPSKQFSALLPEKRG